MLLIEARFEGGEEDGLEGCSISMTGLEEAGSMMEELCRKGRNGKQGGGGRRKEKRTGKRGPLDPFPW